MDPKPVLSVVSTFYNEEQGLPEFLRRLRRSLESFGEPYEIIFVNDASTDRSLEIIAGYSKNDNRIKCITTSRRFTIEPCLMVGLEHAGGDVAITMESDLQDPPEMIPKLLEKWKEGFDVVHSTRTKRLGEEALKLWFIKMAYWAIHWVSDIEIPENTGLFKLFSRKALDALIKLNEKNLYFRGLTCWIGFRQTQIYYERQPRFIGRSRASIYSHSSMRTLFSGLTSFSETLLNFILFAGVGIAGLSVAGMIVTAFMQGWDPSKFIFHFGVWVVLLFIGIQILGIGVLGIYVSRIYQEVRNRPRVIIDSKIGFGNPS